MATSMPLVWTPRRLVATGAIGMNTVDSDRPGITASLHRNFSECHKEVPKFVCVAIQIQPGDHADFLVYLLELERGFDGYISDQRFADIPAGS